VCVGMECVSITVESSIHYMQRVVMGVIGGAIGKSMEVVERLEMRIGIWEEQDLENYVNRRGRKAGMPQL